MAIDQKVQLAVDMMDNHHMVRCKVRSYVVHELLHNSFDAGRCIWVHKKKCQNFCEVCAVLIRLYIPIKAHREAVLIDPGA